MKRIATMITAWVLVASLTLVSGCDSEDTSYDVTISWNISGLKACEASLGGGEFITFEYIVVETINDETQEVDRSQNIPCTDFQYTITNLEEGNYTVKLFAYATYDGMTLAFFQGQGAITAPATAGQNYDFTLVIGKANIDVAWDFTEFGTCGTFGVTDVAVVLEAETEGQLDIQAGTTTCDTGIMPIDGIPWGTYTIVVKGYAGQTQTHQGVYGPVELLPNDYQDPFPVELSAI